MKKIDRQLHDLEKAALCLHRNAVVELVSVFRWYRAYVRKHVNDETDQRALSSGLNAGEGGHG